MNLIAELIRGGVLFEKLNSDFDVPIAIMSLLYIINEQISSEETDF